ncbi:hypothetical protein L9F63_004831 [Diploptera punctata]|uniref:Uncharacterized protein n=1 Tax=Diploptera punctata TaxID=6984 RepID=A0AAD7ZG34_DIPPU|nr:hypothetical protein L9F63_004831 [Diploptera punctata]
MEKKTIPAVKQMIHRLYNLNIALHHNKRSWLAYQLCDREGTGYMNSTALQESIESKFVHLRRIMEVAVTSYEGVYWISLHERKRGRGSGFKPPVYIGYIPGQPYIFTSLNGKNEEIIRVIYRSLGYKGIKNRNLCGKNVMHLYRLLKTSESRASSHEEVLEMKEFKPEYATQTEKGIDFTQKKVKDEYVKNCCVSDGVLQELKVSNSQCAWDVQDVVDMEGCTFEKTELIFRSPDIMKLMTELSEMGVITAPLPNYVTDIKERAKNMTTLHKNK